MSPGLGKACWSPRAKQLLERERWEREGNCWGTTFLATSHLSLIAARLLEWITVLLPNCSECKSVNILGLLIFNCICQEREILEPLWSPALIQRNTTVHFIWFADAVLWSSLKLQKKPYFFFFLVFSSVTGPNPGKIYDAVNLLHDIINLICPSVVLGKENIRDQTAAAPSR